MKMPDLPESAEIFRHFSFPWLRWCSIAVLMVSVAFLGGSLFAFHSPSNLAANLTSSLLLAFSVAVFLNIYWLWQLGTEHRRVDQAFRDTDSEFSSIFHHVLDGILIVDNEGDCLDANPAAAGILRVANGRLIGQNVGRFFENREIFSRQGRSFLPSSPERTQIELTAGDGTSLFVDFTAVRNYLPGRHVLILCNVTERTRTMSSLRTSEERLEHMANSIDEVFWMMDAATQELTYVNRAYATLTGHAVEGLQENPAAFRDLIHPEDRDRILLKLQNLAPSGILDEEFRFIRADGEIRWAWAKGSAVPSGCQSRWLLGTAHDVTARKLAEMKIIEQLVTVEASRAEADALRKATLALSQNLAMDSVLDTLLECIARLVPFDRATMLFAEGGPDLMVAREAPRKIAKRIGLTFKASVHAVLEHILFEKRAFLLRDVAEETEWLEVPPLEQIQSWLGIPLLASGRVIGILSLGAKTKNTFTTEHLRLAKSLAVPAAVAIQNARIHQRAEIYAAELELRLSELRAAQKALAEAKQKPLDPTVP